MTGPQLKEARRLRLSGWTAKAIAAELGIPVGQVQYWTHPEYTARRKEREGFALELLNSGMRPGEVLRAVDDRYYPQQASHDWLIKVKTRRRWRS